MFMGIRQWFVRLLSRGEPPDLDPDELVEVGVVHIHEGPLLIAQLEAEGIEATGIESFDVVTNVRNRMRIMVRRSDVERAWGVISEAQPES